MKAFVKKIKTASKNILFFLIYHSGLLHLYITLILKKKRQFPAVIINYHRFVESFNNEIDREPTVTHLIGDFKKELNFIKRYFYITTLDEIVQTLNERGEFTQPAIAITIDDGTKDNYELLFPVLKENNIPVTIFLTAGLIGTDKQIWVDRLANAISHTPKENIPPNNLWKNKDFPLNSLIEKRNAFNAITKTLKELDREARDQLLTEIENELQVEPQKEPAMLNWQQVREMRENNISFGAHTCTHPILSKMPLENAQKEIEGSKIILEEKLGIKIKHFAYPNGRKQDFNEELKRFCKEIGFESVSTCVFGNNNNTSDPFALKRIGSYVPISNFAVNLVRSFLINE